MSVRRFKKAKTLNDVRSKKEKRTSIPSKIRNTLFYDTANKAWFLVNGEKVVRKVKETPNGLDISLVNPATNEEVGNIKVKRGEKVSKIGFSYNEKDKGAKEAIGLLLKGTMRRERHKGNRVSLSKSMPEVPEWYIRESRGKAAKKK